MTFLPLKNGVKVFFFIEISTEITSFGYNLNSPILGLSFGVPFILVMSEVF